MPRILLITAVCILICCCPKTAVSSPVIAIPQPVLNQAVPAVTPPPGSSKAAEQEFKDKQKKNKGWVGEFVDGVGEQIITTVFAIFIYLTAIIAKTFDQLFQFITDFIFKLINFSDHSVYPEDFQSVIKSLINLLYVVTFGFLFIFFVYSVTTHFWRGDDISKPLLGILFAFALLMAYPLIYKFMFEVFKAISDSAHRIAIQSKTANGGASVFSQMMNIGSYVGIAESKDLKISSLLNATGDTVADLAYTKTIVEHHLNANDYMFFVKYVLIFIISLMGIMAIVEVMFLKGAQIINLFLAYLTGIFAASLVSMEETRETFWDWLRKTAQFMAYNLFWGIIIVAMNMYAYNVSTESGIMSMLYLVVVFAAVKMMAKVGGISEGLMMSQRVMESFGSAMKMDAAIATFGAAKTLGGLWKNSSALRGAAGSALAKGAGAAAGALLSAPGNISTAAKAAAQTVRDYSSKGGIGAKAGAALQAMKGFTPRDWPSAKNKLGVAGGHVKDIAGTFGNNFKSIKQNQAMTRGMKNGTFPARDFHAHMENKYAGNFNKTVPAPLKENKWDTIG